MHEIADSTCGQDNHERGPAAQPPRPLHDPEAMVERLMDWADAARLAGRADRADRLLLLAWEAYDRPARAPCRLYADIRKAA